MYLIVLLVCGMVFVRTAVAFDEEIERLTKLLEQEPNRVDLLKRRALIFRLEARLGEALSDLDRARSLDPNDREVRLQRGLTLSGLRRDQEAETELNVFLERETGRPQVFALAERGRIRARTGRPALAIVDFTAAIAIRPVLELYLARGQVQESMSQLAAAAAGYQIAISRLGRTISLTTALIRVQLAQRQFQSALALVDQEIARAPVKTLWLLRRAEVLAAMGQTAQAQSELQAALAEANSVLERKITAIHLLSRAKVLIAMARLEEARADLDDCVGLTPGFVDCRTLLNRL
jgi:tetratricopeptide (TPR) repeat protein